MTRDHPQHSPEQDYGDDEVKDTHEEAVEQGAERLHRSWPVLLTTGFLRAWRSAWACSRTC